MAATTDSVNFFMRHSFDVTQGDQPNTTVFLET
jgi:hypothetical protein